MSSVVKYCVNLIYHLDLPDNSSTCMHHPTHSLLTVRQGEHFKLKGGLDPEPAIGSDTRAGCPTELPLGLTRPALIIGAVVSSSFSPPPLPAHALLPVGQGRPWLLKSGQHLLKRSLHVFNTNIHV